MDIRGCSVRIRVSRATCGCEAIRGDVCRGYGVWTGRLQWSTSVTVSWPMSCHSRFRQTSSIRCHWSSLLDWGTNRMRRRVPDWSVNSRISSQRSPEVIGSVGVAVLCGAVQLLCAGRSAPSLPLPGILSPGTFTRTLHPTPGEYKQIQLHRPQLPCLDLLLRVNAEESHH